jgi:hypothetical protein
MTLEQAINRAQHDAKRDGRKLAVPYARLETWPA